MDIIFIENLKIPASIGIWDWEHRIKQTLILDIQLSWDIKSAASSDDIQQAVSYKEVAMRVCQLVEESRFKLLETVAEKTAQLVLEEFGVSWCKVKVSKPRAVERAGNVGVMIERVATDGVAEQ